MKCPKCDYLGFETGDRCRNCGYDFSLLAAPVEETVDLSLAPEPGEPVPLDDLWIARPSAEAAEAPVQEAAMRLEPLSLFAPGTDADDEPLIKVPSEPRAPLAVRRAPDSSRARPASRTPRRREDGLTLEFAQEAAVAAPAAEPQPRPAPSRPAATAPPAHQPAAPSAVRSSGVAARLGSRVGAAAIDHGILLGVDVVVLYGTLRMTSLTMSEWSALPAIPLLAFLALVKLAYFSSFTAIGGQTIGKMAVGIRVVADDPWRMDPPRAIGRTLGGALSLLSLGLGLLPALVTPDRRAFHDRVAHTRVVELPSA